MGKNSVALSLWPAGTEHPLLLEGSVLSGVL